MTRDSAYNGTPANLYRIVYGDNPENVFLYTNADVELDYEGETYLPEPVKHDQINQEGRPKANELKINVSRKSALAAYLRNGLPRRVLFVTIYEGELEGSTISDVNPIWHGRIAAIEPLGAVITIKCAPAGAGMKQPALTRTYSRLCNVPLYGDLCQADKAAATVTGTVASIDGANGVTLTTGWNGTMEVDYFLGGMIEWESDEGVEIRAILSIENDAVLLDGPNTGLAVSDEVNMILGCPRTMDACRTLHNNINNYGGCPYVPTDNIFNKSMI